MNAGDPLGFYKRQRAARQHLEPKPHATTSTGGGEGPSNGDGDGPSYGTELTEDGVALAFTARFAGRLRFDHDAGQWFEWTGDRWKADGTGLAFSWCRQVARDLSQGAKEGERATVRRRSFAAGVEAFARADRAHAARQDVWDRDRFLLGVPGGVVDLRTGQLAPADSAQGITKLAAVAPAERDDCPLWDAFLLEAAGGDRDNVAFLRRWFGYCLTGDTREHALIFV
jgi:putative DNA primase/helicase